MSHQAIFLSQGIDYLGFLNAKLRDLKGWATLLNELVQNADDPEDATRITLDVTDEALIVANDGLFTDCGAIEQSRCGFDNVGDGRTCCDFHAFRRVASGHKRQEEGTTGAFGIGFISVYQITDRPSLRSGNWQWTLFPEQEETRRIEARQIDHFKGTQFVLPWAKTGSDLRTRLGLELVPADVVDRMCEQLSDAMLLAAPFLKRLEILELRKRGKPELVVSCVRDSAANEILIDVNGQTRVWKRLKSTFDLDAILLRKSHFGRIEEKRKAEVTVAVPLDGLSGNGRLYATLPTEDEVGLPLLINADFFPSSDRKRILFDGDFQGDWNRAAIRAAARSIAGALPDLRNQLKATELWELFEAARALQRQAAEGKVDKEFASFWGAIQPQLKAGKFIFSSKDVWCSSDEIRILQNAKEESVILPLLESLNQNIVHLDLQTHLTLLRENDVGVKTLTLDDLSSALIAADLNKPSPIEGAPLWLRNAEHRRQLGVVIERLHERVAKDAKPVAEQRIGSCSVFLSTDGRLAPARQMRGADRETRQIFAALSPPDYWMSESNSPELSKFVGQFLLRDAIRLIEQTGSEKLRALYSKDHRFASDLINWIAGHQHFVAQHPDVRTLVRALPIWPSGGMLHPLNELSVPGGFKDPLALAKILDTAIAQTWQSFLIDGLGAQELTLETYLVDQVPGVFEETVAPPTEIRQSLMKLLIAHSGTLLENAEVARALRTVPLVRCTDGEYRCGRDVYFKVPPVTQILGNSVPTALISDDAGSVLESVLNWLGVRNVPDANDILRTIDAVTEEGPTEDRRAHIQSIFRGLAEHWLLLSEQEDDLEELRSAQWLPATTTQEWHRPSDVFSAFREYLFATQGTFLDIPRGVQNLASQTSLFDFLDVKQNPPIQLVVKHLLAMAERGEAVNMEVYEFLTQNVGMPAINSLRGTKCLCLPDHTYIEGTKALWGHHRFGRFRVRLSSDWRRYQKLLEVLGVAEDEPTAKDAVAVLQEIAADYVDNRNLDDADYETLIQCWTILSEHHEADASWVSQLAEKKVVANANHYLRRPKEIFFDDRPGLVNRFGDSIRLLVVQRPASAWLGMQMAGVRLLSDVVSTELVECIDPITNDDLTKHLADRWPLVRRVFATRDDNVATNGSCESPEVRESQKLAIVYRFDVHPSPAEEVTVHLTDDKRTLFIRQGGKNLWLAVAKELAHAYFPDAGAGPLASAIKDVLQASDVATAKEGLDELGVADIDFSTGNGDGGVEIGIGALISGDVGTGEGASPYETGAPENGSTPGNEVPKPSDPEPPEGETPPPEAGSGDPPSTEGKISTTPEPTGKVKPTGDPKKPTVPKGNRPKLRSYMGHDGDETGQSQIGTGEYDNPTDRAGVDLVLKFEHEQGRFPKEMPHENEGYDVESRDGSGVIVRYIEIKSMGGPWDGFGVGLSAPQFRTAQKMREAFWLYVVEEAVGNEPKIHRIQDPATQIVEYRFDDGWQIVAESDQVPPKRRSLGDAVKARLANDDTAEAEDSDDVSVS